MAKSFTLKVAKNVHVTNTPTKSFRVKAVDVHEAVAVGQSGYAVYTFQGETTRHLICKKTTQRQHQLLGVLAAGHGQVRQGTEPRRPASRASSARS